LKQIRNVNLRRSHLTDGLPTCPMGIYENVFRALNKYYKNIWECQLTIWTRALGFSINNSTLCVDSTGLRLQARIFTVSLNAHLVCITIIVSGAFCFFTFFARFPEESIGTAEICKKYLNFNQVKKLNKLLNIIK